MSPRRAKAYLFLIATAAIWGAAGPVIKFTLDSVDPIPFLAYRFFISAIFSTIFLVTSKFTFRKLTNNWRIYISYGLLAVPFALGALFVGLDRATVLDLTISTAISPLVVSVLAHFILKDHLTKREKVGIAIVLVGVFVNSLLPIFLDGNAKITGDIFIILYILFDAASVIVAKLATKKRIKSSNLTNVAFVIGLLTIVPVSITSYGFQETITIIKNLPFSAHLGVWYMALISGVLAYYLFIRGQKTIEVSEGILFNYLQPLFAIPLAVFWLQEKPTIPFVIGAVLITIGVIIAELKTKSANSG